MLLANQITSKLYLDLNEEKLLLQFYEKGEEIPLFDQGFWQVYRGVVQLSRINAKGEEITLGWATGNTAFGNILEHTGIDRAQALSDVYVRWLSPQDLENYPHFSRILLEQLSRRLIVAEHLLTITGLKKVEDRLWELLLLLKQEIGQTVTNGTRLTVRFTHQNLADMICATRVTVTRMLGDFQTRGLIVVDRDRHLVVKDVLKISN
ncbi:putative transcriptional regulator, Crp/Fnr family [Stanieria cyanosphaera PCC 7437]|uniref:Transcriptional regulator, Crp/Fnr family n=1 Tax=Stanieria cyanosphaera (strain ATCC 29371 / PCC 7437) TaxID=111780 RepID=K9XYU0_STAC7|nr:Crp/Fnr family transcriptional regulator [Stanieria cyanosphaera]AFZ37296.1 putative transcriptional regulator, Crp/Fnr family [Stanieria cyanosphaera PCC 7437]